MRILAINPPITDFAAYDLWAWPLGLLYLISYLERSGHSIDLLDCRYRYHPLLLAEHPPKNKRSFSGPYFKTPFPKPEPYQSQSRQYYLYGLPPEKIESYLTAIQTPDLIIISGLMTYWYPGIIYIAQRCKSLFPRTPIYLGGIYATLCPDHAASLPHIDAVFGREQMNDFFHLIHSGNFEDFINSMEDLTPAYHHYQRLPSLAWLTGIGCPFRCEVCASSQLNPHFTKFDTLKNAQNLQRLLKKKHTHHIAFYDDALLVRAEESILPWLEQINATAQGLAFHTPNGLHLRYISQEVARALKKANFQTLRLSLESKLPAYQQKMDQKVTNSEFETALERLRSAGFTPSQLEVYVMMGLPDQHIREVAETIFYLAELNVKTVLAAYSPIPGTPLFTKHFESQLDPLWHNQSVYHSLSGQDISLMKKIRHLVSLINQGIDQGCNIWADPLLKKIIKVSII